jgi:hypothetical protein
VYDCDLFRLARWSPPPPPCKHSQPNYSPVRSSPEASSTWSVASKPNPCNTRAIAFATVVFPVPGLPCGRGQQDEPSDCNSRIEMRLEMR